MGAINVTYEMLEKAFKKNKYDGIPPILGKDGNGAVLKLPKAKKYYIFLIILKIKKQYNQSL